MLSLHKLYRRLFACESWVQEIGYKYPVMIKPNVLSFGLCIWAIQSVSGVTLFEDVFDYPIGQDLPPLYFMVGSGDRAVVERGFQSKVYDLEGGSVAFPGPSLEMETEMNYGVPINNQQVDQTATFYVGMFLRLDTPGSFGNGITGIAIFNESDPSKDGLILGAISSGAGDDRQELAVIGVGARPSDQLNSPNLATAGGLVLEPEKTYLLAARFDADLNGREGALRGYAKLYGPDDPIPSVEPTEWDLTIVRDKQWPLTEREKVLNRIQLFRGNSASRIGIDDLRVVASFEEIVDPARIPEVSTFGFVSFLGMLLLRRGQRK